MKINYVDMHYMSASEWNVNAIGVYIDLRVNAEDLSARVCRYTKDSTFRVRAFCEF